MMSATNYFEKPAFSPESGVMTVRPSSTALLTIDSQNRFDNYLQQNAALTSITANNNSPYDFSITKRESIMNGFFTRLGLTEVCFPWTIPNINPKTNTMVVRHGPTSALGSNAIITIDVDWYKPHALAAAFQKAVRGVSTSLSSFAVQYAPTFGGGQPENPPTFYYETNGGDYIAFFPMTYNSPAYPYPSTTKQLFNVLGFTNANSVAEIVGNGTYTLCQSTKYVDIVCGQLAYNQALKDTTTQQVGLDSLCRLYLGDANGFGANQLNPSDSNFCPPGCAPSVIYRQFQTPKMIMWNSAGKAYQPVPGVLRFQVFDDQGAILTEIASSQGGGVPADYLDWSATILVSEN
jgi:hypothetical protein